MWLLYKHENIHPDLELETQKDKVICSMHPVAASMTASVV
jgi:hypothetical protein